MIRQRSGFLLPLVFDAIHSATSRLIATQSVAAGKTKTNTAFQLKEGMSYFDATF